MGNRNDSHLKMTATNADNGSEDSEKRNICTQDRGVLNQKQAPPDPRPHEAGGHGMELLQGHCLTKAVLRTE